MEESMIANFCFRFLCAVWIVDHFDCCLHQVATTSDLTPICISFVRHIRFYC
jgi:hypothetical protein